VAERDWYDWHADYDRPGSGLAQRLGLVQDQIRVALDAAPAGPLRAISLCAGQGRDLIGALASHPRRDDVTARLVELDPRNTAVARRLAATAGLTRVQVVTGDAARASHYEALAPANLVLACGLFGNITEADIEARRDPRPADRAARASRRAPGGGGPWPRRFPGRPSGAGWPSRPSAARSARWSARAGTAGRRASHGRRR